MSAYEAGESFVQTLIMNLDSLLLSFKDTLTPTNFDKFVGVLTTEVTARLEKVIFKTTFNKVLMLFLYFFVICCYVSKFLVRRYCAR